MAEEVRQAISLLDQIKEVAKRRHYLEDATSIWTEAFDAWKGTHIQLYSAREIATQQVNEAETLLRELTIKAYNETGSKAPAPGVAIREVTKLEYDPKEAFAWAKEHGIALKLDVPTFEKIAKTAPETKPGFVTIRTEPQATIATDLSKVLEEKK